MPVTISGETLTQVLEFGTVFDSQNNNAALLQVSAGLARAKDGKSDLAHQLKQAEEPIRADSWEDTLSSWQALMDLLAEMKSKRGVAQRRNKNTEPNTVAVTRRNGEDFVVRFDLQLSDIRLEPVNRTFVRYDHLLLEPSFCPP